MIGDHYIQLRSQLREALSSLLALCQETDKNSEAVKTLQALNTELGEPIRFIVAGEDKAGKSSLLNALFGTEFCPVSPARGTDRVQVYQWGEVAKDVTTRPNLMECCRPEPFLRDFQLIDTPATNILANYQVVTEQLVPAADLVIVVFSVSNPWASSVWDFLGLISKRWHKNLIFVIQQIDLRSPEDVAAVVDHLQTTIRLRLGEARPIFPVSAKKAFAAKQAGGKEPEDLLEQSRFTGFEAYIENNVFKGERRLGLLRSACATMEKLLAECGKTAQMDFQSARKDAEALHQLEIYLAERKEHSSRQITGGLWALSQAYQTARKRDEEALCRNIALHRILQSVFSPVAGGFARQRSSESKLDESLGRQLEDSAAHLESDLEEAWKQLREEIDRKAIGPKHQPVLPPFSNSRDELLGKLKETLVERKNSQPAADGVAGRFRATFFWLRLAASLIAGGGIATVLSLVNQTPILDITLSILVLGALLGGIVALIRRHAMLQQFRAELVRKREAVVTPIEEHLRQSIQSFYQRVQEGLDPMLKACAAEMESRGPVLHKLREVEETLGRVADATGVSSGS